MSEPSAAVAPAPAAGFTPDQDAVTTRLSRVLGIFGPLLVLAGVLRLVYGVIEIATASWGGLLVLPEGALLAFAGLTFIVGAGDAAFLATVKGREKAHLSNTLDSIRTGFTALLGLGCYVAFIAFIKIWI